MNIAEFIEKCKSREVYTAALIVLVALASFGLGRLSKLQESREPIKIEHPNETVAAVSVALPPTNSGGQVVASKSGDKYHFPWCGGAARISEANKVWFNSVEEARKAGYTPASNCKGLK